MTRPLRVQYAGAVYHVTARGNERQAIFRADADRERFLGVLARAVERYRLIIHAYVLMENHYHVLLETQEANLALAIRHLNGVYTSAFNRIHDRVGHLFQGRYKAIIVEKESYLVELSRYIHLNPVRVRQPNPLMRYPWSSYWDYIGTRRPPGWLRLEEVLGPFGGLSPMARQTYRRFVEEGARTGVARPWDQVVGQAVLGREGFVKAIQKRIEEQGLSDEREVAGRRHLAPRPSWSTIVQLVHEMEPELAALTFGVRSDPVHALSVYLARECGGISLKDLARRTGKTLSTLSDTARRVAQRRRQSQAWDEALEQIEQAIIRNP